MQWLRQHVDARFQHNLKMCIGMCDPLKSKSTWQCKSIMMYIRNEGIFSFNSILYIILRFVLKVWVDWILMMNFYETKHISEQSMWIKTEILNKFCQQILSTSFSRENYAFSMRFFFSFRCRNSAERLLDDFLVIFLFKFNVEHK